MRREPIRRAGRALAPRQARARALGRSTDRGKATSGPLVDRSDVAPKACPALFPRRSVPRRVSGVACRSTQQERDRRARCDLDGCRQRCRTYPQARPLYGAMGSAFGLACAPARARGGPSDWISPRSAPGSRRRSKCEPVAYAARRENSEAKKPCRTGGAEGVTGDGGGRRPATRSACCAQRSRSASA